MPYLLTEDGVIVEDLNGVSWTDVIKRQRAVAANAARVAAMYAELDELAVEAIQEVVESPDIPDESRASELVKIVVGNEQDKALTASVLSALESTNARLEMSERTTEALVAALSQIGQPVVNVAPADVRVDVPPPHITVESPQITVNPPEIKVEPQITVRPEIVVPSPSKTVTFERDPLTHQVTRAEVTEA